MDLMILKKKIEGYRGANGSIKHVAPELLLELRQTWEHFTGSLEQFRAELGMKAGTLRNLLVESKKLNHVLASSGAMGLMVESTGEIAEGSESPTASAVQQAQVLELLFDGGNKAIRFPNVDSLVDFLRKTA